MIYSSEDMQTRAVLDTAARMCAAARTAPKTRGMDGLVTCVVTGEDKDRLAAHMRELAGRLDYAFFARDADRRGGRRPGRQPRDVLRRPCRPEPRSARRLRHARPRHSPQRQRKVPVL